MKFLVTVVALVVVVALARAGHIKNIVPGFAKFLNRSRRGPAKITADKGNAVETSWMLQHLDHFDKEDKRTWQMRYMVNEEHFVRGGPMFIHVGGHSPISAEVIQSGIFHDLAKEHKGILFYPEHRYYGASNPTRNLSMSHLKYLHTKQALADLALFIRTQRRIDRHLANSKVIMAGGAYAGSLVIWFSKLYPDLVNGGWASSAPILAQVDFKEYNEMSGKAYRLLGSQQCYNRIQNGIAELEAMFGDNRWAEAKAMLLLCDTFDHRNNLDLGSLFYAIADAFTSNTLFQTRESIYGTCNYVTNFEDDLTAVIAVFLIKNFFGQECVDVTYKNGVTIAMDLSPRSGNPRPWFYQMCNEFGWFKTTTSKEQPFGTKVPVTLHRTLCYDVFGPQYATDHIDKVVTETNKIYGGLQPGVRRVYVTQGALDPWSSLGLNETHGASVIPYVSHCSDFNAISSSDSAAMRASKLHLVNLVRGWLA